MGIDLVEILVRVISLSLSYLPSKYWVGFPLKLYSLNHSDISLELKSHNIDLFLFTEEKIGLTTQNRSFYFYFFSKPFLFWRLGEFKLVSINSFNGLTFLLFFFTSNN